MIPIRVLIVDDSRAMRDLIRATLARDSAIEVVGEAGDAAEARAAIKALDPDAITLDIEMPRMDGLELLERLTRLRPTPVIMVSSQTRRGAHCALKALRLGAIDCVAKPTLEDPNAFDELAAKVRVAGMVRRGNLSWIGDGPTSRPKGDQGLQYVSDGRMVAIGSSTGGVQALLRILSRFPANCPPTVITQHLPARFTKSFAEHLNRDCAPSVVEATEGAKLEVGRVYVAPGSVAHLEIVGSPGGLRCHLAYREPLNGHRPSVDALFNSVAVAAGSRAVGAILTGMGQDGANGLLAMRNAGARTLGQDEASCVVYGMPKAAFEIGAVEKQVPLSRMSDRLLACTGYEKEG